MCTDTLFGSTKAFGGITCAQLFVGKESKYTAVYGMKHERDGPEAFEDFIRDKGAPFCIWSDNSKMQTGNKWRRLMQKYNIRSENTEPHHPNQNPAEQRIQDVKRCTSKVMDRTRAPLGSWFLCMLYVVMVMNKVVPKGSTMSVEQ